MAVVVSSERRDERERVSKLLSRHKALESGRGQWMQHWEDLARLMLPRRLGFVSQQTEGERRTEDIYDGVAMRAARSLANSMAAMLRPEGEQWLFMRAADDGLSETDEVRSWLEFAEERLMTALFNPAARFRESMGEADLDLVVFGTAVVFGGRSRRLDRLTFQSLHLKDTVVAYDDERNPDTMFRTHRFTLRQAEEKFGRDNLSDAVRQKLEGGDKLDERIPFLHVVTPRPEGSADAVMARNLPFADLWIETEAEKIVAEAGFHEFPFSVARWDTSSGEDYGRSPGMIALPDAATAQAMGETLLVAGQRAADPPLMAPNDGAFDAINTFPGGISYYDVETAAQLRGNPFFPLDTRMNLPITRDMQIDTREQIRQAFFANVFNLPVPGTQMTATEVMERKEEFIREIGPVFGRLETDYIAPVVERAFSVMLRSGSFDPIPEALRGAEVRFEFESPVKKLREQAEATAAGLWAQEMLAMGGVKPEAVDMVNVEELGRFSAQALNLPERIVTSREAMQAIREQRAEAQREAMEREKVAQEASIAKEGAGAARDVAQAGQSVPGLAQALGGGA